MSKRGEWGVWMLWNGRWQWLRRPDDSRLRVRRIRRMRRAEARGLARSYRVGNFCQARARKIPRGTR